MKTPIQLKGMLLLAALAISAIAAEPAKPAVQSFLFIGNSFTFRHELKDVFLTLAKEGNPGVDFSAERVTYGGRDMFRHFELFRSQDLLRLPSLSDEEIRSSMKEMNAMAGSAEEPGFYKEYWKSIDSTALKPWEDYEANGNNAKPTNPNGPSLKPSQWTGDRKTIKTAIENHEAWISNRKNFPPAWSYVVLQSWQDVITNPETGYIKYATKFAEVAKRQNTKVVLYLTAPYSQNKEPVGEPLAQERAFKELHIASDLAKKTGAIVVPVPLAVYRLQKSGAAIPLRYKNDGHPNQYGAYLTACLLYAAVFNKSPEGLSLSQVVETKIVDKNHPNFDPDGNPLQRVFTDDERRLIQRTAWESIEAFRKGEF